MRRPPHNFAPPCVALGWTLLLCASAFWGGAADASCNVIPRATEEFRGAQGLSNRPFAGPGDFVRIQIDDSGCEGSTPGFEDLGGEAGAGDDYQVTVVFVPPGDGERNAAVVSPNCAAIGTEVMDACRAALDGGEVHCIDANPAQGAPGLAVPDPSTLLFRFPDTDDQLSGEDHTWSGPAAVAVTAAGEALPCSLSRLNRCTSVTGTLACIDEIFESGTCSTSANRIDPVFPSFTALPPPNSFQAMCTTADSSCQAASTSEVHLTTDRAGNALIPMDWSGVQLFLESVPIPRVVDATTAEPAFSDASDPVDIPGRSFLASYSPEGILVPPIFSPLSRDDASEVTLFGTIDAPRTVIRVSRRSPEGSTCAGGAEVGSVCLFDDECPGSECGTSLFDFGDRFDQGVGPVIVSVSSADVRSPVPLDGMLETEKIFAFAVSEAIEGGDLNQDDDQLDLVMTLGSRELGLGDPLSAVVRVRQPPFRFAAAAVEEDVVAYLESEPAEGETDASQDGDVADTLLRVFRDQGELAPADLLGGEVICGEVAPRIDGAPLAFSDGLLFFRTPESACESEIVELVSLNEAGFAAETGTVGPNASTADQQILSKRAERVLVESNSVDMAAEKSSATNDVFLRDAETGTSWLSQGESGGQASAGMERGLLSSDGRFAVFDSVASDLVAGTPDDGARRVYRHEIASGETRLVGPGLAECEGENLDDCMIANSVSADGSVVIFTSRSTHTALKPAEREAREFHVYRVDLDSGNLPEAMDVNDELELSNASSLAGVVSADGTRVVFQSLGRNLDAPDPNPFADIYVRDLGSATTRRVSVATDGSQGIGDNIVPSLSADGRFVSFASSDSLLVQGDTNGQFDSFVHDLETGITERISVTSAGVQASGGLSSAGALDAEGRHVAFSSGAENLVGGDENAVSDVFVHDRLAGITRRVSLRATGEEASGQSQGPVDLSADGRSVAFGSDDGEIDSNDTNSARDLFIRAPAPGLGDLTGDQDSDDDVLQVFDVRDASPAARSLGAAERAAIHAGSVALLRPESSDGVSRNGDADSDDAIVHFWPNRDVGDPVSLGLSAGEVVLSTNWIAVLVSEASEGGVDRNGDGDASDSVVALHPAAGSLASGWINVGQAADAIDVRTRPGGDTVVAWLTPEWQQGPGGTDLNGDADSEDRVLQLAHVSGDGDWTLVNVGRAAEDFVLGDRIVAFRTSEENQGASLLNGDTDSEDDVLEVWDLDEGRLVQSGQAIVPCRFEVCDARIPYRVSGETVIFLTQEQDQGVDLNEDGDAEDLVVQRFTLSDEILVAKASSTGAVITPALGQTLAAVGSGVCSDTGEACSTDAACGSLSCFVPPGKCFEPLAESCDLSVRQECAEGSLCISESETSGGVCHALGDDCRRDADCEAGFCGDVSQRVHRLPSPLGTGASGESVFMSLGMCQETLPGTSCEEHAHCDPGQMCGSAGACQIAHGPCASDSDCLAGSCGAELLVVSAAESDSDGVHDSLDNCPRVFNPRQQDLDGDGTGDACDHDADGDRIEEDGDGSGVTGDAPCAGGATTACDDNCAGVANEMQEDADGDAVGDVCDQADLVVTLVTGPSVAAPGESVSLAATVSNAGHEGAEPGVSFFLSDDASIDPATDRMVGTCTPSRIAPGSQQSCEDAASLVPIDAIDPPDTPRPLYWGACTDTGMQVEELDESNNCSAGEAVLVPEPARGLLQLVLLVTLRTLARKRASGRHPG